MGQAKPDEEMCRLGSVKHRLPRGIGVMHYVYVLKSEKDGNMYVGCTTDLRERFSLHNAGKVKPTRERRPFQLVYYEASLSQEDGLRREKYLKTACGKRYLKNRLREELHERG